MDSLYRSYLARARLCYTPDVTTLTAKGLTSQSSPIMYNTVIVNGSQELCLTTDYKIITV